MAKVRKTGSHSGSGYRQRGTTHRGRPASRLPYGIGAAVILVVVFALAVDCRRLRRERAA